VAAVGTLVATASGGLAGDDVAPKTPTATQSEAPVNIFVHGPGDLGALLKSLTEPDFVILRGEEYRRLRAPLHSPAAAAAVVSGGTVGAVVLEGRAQGELAQLTLDLEVMLTADGPLWVDVRLDGQRALTSVTEEGRALPLRFSTTGGWQVELQGRRSHHVRVELLAAVRSTLEGARLEVVVPEASSTRVALVVPGSVAEATTGPGEPVATTAEKTGGGTRLAADLTPRSRLALTWKIEEPKATRLPPLLVAQGEIAIDVDPGSFRTRSSWSIRSLRGEARELVLRLDPADEVLEVELDNQPPAARIEKAGDARRMTIALSEPLGPNQERRLVLTTRRSIATGASTRFTFSGFPLAEAKEQSGSIGVVTSDNLWVTGTPGRGVRQVDPRTELPPELRSRPATTQAFRFSEQPFDLAVRIEPSPPLVRVASRTTVMLEKGTARIDSRFDFETARGQLFDLSLGLPPSLEVVSVGPKSVVENWQIGILPTALGAGLPYAGQRLLDLRLGPTAQAGGRFTIQVVTRQALPRPAGEVAIALVQPLGALTAGGRIAVLSDPSLTADLSERRASESANQFQPASPSPPTDWPWPGDRPPAAPPLLWLRYDRNPADLPLRVTEHSRTVSTATSLSVQVGGRQAEVRQETECAVQFGTLDTLNILVPASIGTQWDVEGGSRRIELGKTKYGHSEFRLEWNTAPSLPLRLRFRYRVVLDTALAPGAMVDLTVPWIRVVDTTSTTPVRAVVDADPGLTVTANGSAWTPSAAPATGQLEDTLRLRVSSLSTVVDPDALPLRVAARRQAELPRAVASRLWLCSRQGADGELVTRALFRLEACGPELSVALPTGSVLLAVWVGGVVVREVEPLSEPGAFRLALPPTQNPGAVPVELNYQLPASRTSGPWMAPRLLGDAVVQQTLWEVRVPWNRALVGVPSGWSDENEWFWDQYLLKRRPELTTRALADWVSDPNPPADPLGDDHGYLFGHAGGSASLSVAVASRALLVALCSGVVLLVGGGLILLRRPYAPLAWLAVALAALASGTALHPSVTLLIVQSAALGVFLTASIALMQRSFVAPRARASSMRELARRDASGSPGSSLVRSVGVGSDDSTAIRVRTSSTAEYVAIPPVAPDHGADNGVADGVAPKSAVRRGVEP
jgi:hypothetical protein